MPPRAKIRDFDRKTISYDACEKASVILEYTHDSARSILKAFDEMRSIRDVRGTTTDEEQDLLRAMLVMCGAGLDAMTKQLIRDALAYIIYDNQNASNAFQDFIEKQLSLDFESLQEGRKAKFAPSMLATYDLPEKLTNQYVNSLTAGSLQSADELLRIAAAFGLTDRSVKTNFIRLKEIFEVRNKIIHELDINLDAERRNRNTRNRTTMVRDSNYVLAAGEEFLVAVDKQVDICQSM